MQIARSPCSLKNYHGSTTADFMRRYFSSSVSSASENSALTAPENPTTSIGESSSVITTSSHEHHRYLRKKDKEPSLSSLIGKSIFSSHHFQEGMQIPFVLLPYS